MTGKVAVVDRIPTFRAGLAAVLEQGGFEVAEPEPPEFRTSYDQLDAAVVTIHAADMHTIRALLAEFPELIVVAVLVSPAIEDFCGALRAGAHGGVQWDSTPDEILAVVRAALAGQSLLPAPIVRALAESSVERPEGGTLREDEIRWLRAIARGTSVVRLARNEGYSQREIFRRLSDLYARMGVRNRHEAIALASRWGLLMPAPEPAVEHRTTVLQLRQTN
ncbi:response regulator transcription factor [Pseudonocardia xinjiangensis]|uniref:Response regulator transcription factor n=1 Tax=Pseudonocardia xinjiangensis TaxID=75289 RepID=A0ABX1RAH3_9PSEU|nr:response regulator transcription factor [Pseudonocardia xinjiangensis]NMH76166.1 response regulator transcription factor [Pseudonocardia xinjiangensis]